MEKTKQPGGEFFATFHCEYTKQFQDTHPLQTVNFSIYLQQLHIYCWFNNADISLRIHQLFTLSLHVCTKGFQIKQHIWTSIYYMSCNKSFYTEQSGLSFVWHRGLKSDTDIITFSCYILVQVPDPSSISFTNYVKYIFWNAWYNGLANPQVE